MKKIIHEIASVLCICLATTFLLCVVANVVSRKDSAMKYNDFMGQVAPVDVLFFGTSHMLNTIYPMELWGKYGIVSYNFGGYDCHIPTSYWMMRNTLEQTKPKLVVIDCYYLGNEDKKNNKEELMHISLDAFPLSVTKWQAVNDLFGDSKERMAFLWPFSTYHNRWKELSKEDFTYSSSVEKGAGIRIGSYSCQEPDYIAKEEKLIQDTQGIVYLRKMIEHCQKSDIDVMLTYVPYLIDENRQREAHTAAEIAKEYGIICAELEELSAIINFETDFADDDHLNYSGGEKITNYIGNLIQENYDVEDRRADPRYEKWLVDAEKYAEYKHTLMRQQTSAAMFLPLLADDMLTSVMLINGQWEYGAADALLSDWGVPQGVLDENKTFLAIMDRQKGVCELVMEGQEWQTAFGTMALVQNDGIFTVEQDGAVLYTLTPQDDIGMWLRILDTRTGSLVYETLFNTKGHH